MLVGRPAGVKGTLPFGGGCLTFRPVRGSLGCMDTVAMRGAMLSASDMLPSRTVDDATWVEALRQGDRRALEPLVRRHQASVRSVALRLCGDRDEADDLAQRAFLKAWESVAELRGAFRPWVMRIVVNLAKNARRDAARFVRDLPEEPSGDRGADDRLADARRRARVRAALWELSESQRSVVLLRVDAQLSFAELADALGITENNAKVTYHHAVRRLRDLAGADNDGL